MAGDRDGDGAVCQGGVGGVDGVTVVGDVGLGLGGGETVEGDLDALGGVSRVHEDDGDRVVLVLESGNTDAGGATRGRDAVGAGAHEAGPHGEGPEAAGGGDGLTVASDEIGARLKLVHLDALPIDVGGKVGVGDAGVDLGCPRHALAQPAALVPRRAPPALQVRRLRLP